VLLVCLCDLYKRPRVCAAKSQGDTNQRPYVESLPWRYGAIVVKHMSFAALSLVCVHARSVVGY
jgi:hypothetical protein